MAVCFAAKFSFTDPNVQLAVGGLLAVMLVGIVAFALVDRWRKRQANDTFTTHDEMASFRVLYERGELSRDEFDRIRGRLTTRLKGELQKGDAKKLNADTVRAKGDAETVTDVPDDAAATDDGTTTEQEGAMPDDRPPA